ncbi:MAG: patatin-like phospholipase family protein [Acholeplasmataceae bacterium]|jgi:NTE family protein
MKIGLMLGGGGVFGAYQVGVIKALMEEDLLKEISVMAGTSIGAINILMLMSEFTMDEIEAVWLNFNNNSIYKGNRIYFKDEKKGLIDINPLYDALTADMDVSRVHNSKIRGYATLKEVKAPNLRYQINYFHGKLKSVLLNEASDPFQVAKGSASVPMLFGSTKIDDHYYVDGGMIENNPMEPLLEEKCELILAVPIASKFNRKKIKNENVTVIDFRCGKSFSRLDSFNKVRSMDFNEKLIDKLKDEGYKAAKEIIELLKKRQIIVDNHFKIDLNEHKYYNLSILKEE